jgi:hypothetical protein
MANEDHTCMLQGHSTVQATIQVQRLLVRSTIPRVGTRVARDMSA